MAKGRKVQVTRLDTEETFPTIAEAVIKMLVSESTLRGARLKNRTTVNGIPIRFEETTASVRSRPVRSVDTSEVFESGSAAAKAYGIPITSMNKAIKECKRVGGCYWRYI